MKNKKLKKKTLKQKTLEMSKMHIFIDGSTRQCYLFLCSLTTSKNGYLLSSFAVNTHT